MPKIIVDSDRVHYLKSASLYQDKSIYLVLRQENKYEVSVEPLNDDYINALVLLNFDTKEEAQKHLKVIEENFLDETLAIDLIGENHLQFIDGIEYDFKVTGYYEQIMPQTKDDWKERYYLLSEWHLQSSHRAHAQYEIIHEIKELATRCKKEIARGYDGSHYIYAILSLITDDIMHPSGLNFKRNLLSEISNKIDKISSSISHLKGES